MWKRVPILAALASFAFAASALAQAPATFPANPDVEYEQSIITIPIYAGTKEPVEILKLTAWMRLVREAPTRNGLGHRQLEFTIADWELYGYSEFLKADVTFKLSNVPIQPKSLAVSLVESQDYPAIIVYNAIYDIYIGQKRVAMNRPGVAFAKNVYEIPPRNISVAFSKPFSLSGSFPLNASAAAVIAKNTAADPTASRSEVVLFADGTCEDMVQTTKEEYEAGVAIGKAIRAGTMTLAQSAR